MTVFRVVRRLLILAPLVLCLSGCFPVGEGPADEEKDPHYLAGKARMSSMDYDGAINAFENAVASNPKSAAAHFELGLLYEEKKNNYAAAIYHLERHLELRPESNMAETVKQHVLACKLELAKTVPFALVNRQVQDELRKLYATNSLLHDQVQQLKALLVEQSVAFSNKLALAYQLAAAQSQAQVPTPPASEPERRSGVTEKQNSQNLAKYSPRPAAMPRTHVIKPGETLSNVAKRYNLKLSAVQSANPSVDPRRLRAGQIINIPPNRN
jgi:LysM repeat protein